MVCTLEELRSKDVINVVNGENLGRIDDLQMNAQTASVTALILYGRPRLWGIFGPRDNCIIDFRQIPELYPRFARFDAIQCSPERSGGNGRESDPRFDGSRTLGS